MPDYGHDLEFGVFLTPRNAEPAAVVELAVGAERVGLDLVTFQDHPYQPRFLDAWTLLTWVAARTNRVHLAGNVLNLPLRNPAVLARSAASLDLLSAGRFELALGAGSFWDAIQAMGGMRLSPGQAVQGLSEAIDVIRGIWDTSTREPLRAGGTIHRVNGAKRGPVPAHDMPIWLGAYKPRMLRLVGTKADGWLPSVGHFKPGDMAAANRVIDEAAGAAGRDPGAIRRLLNVTTDHSDPADLASLALQEGTSVFILASDDEHQIARFGKEIAPATRELVNAAR